VDGIGFVFADDDPIAGVDFDDALGDDGKLLEWAKPLVVKLDSFTDISPSATGCKTLVRGKKPGKLCKKKHGDGEVEIYERERFYAVTGHPLAGTPQTINDRQEQLAEVYHEVFTKKKAAPGKATADTTAGATSARDLADDKLLDLARAARNGAKFAALYDRGDTSLHDNDNSRADAALCEMLAFWTNKDAARMDRLFRGSKLFRPKWDEKRGETTYGGKTIAEANRLCQEGYTGSLPDGNGNGHDGDGARSAAPKTGTGPAAITNAVPGKKKDSLVALPMADVLGRVRQATGDWPRRVSSALFVHDGGDVAWLQSTAALFGFLGSKAGVIRWHGATGCVTKEEVYHELRRTATGYAGVEVLPHEPPIPTLYYAHGLVTPGDGQTLEAFLNHFRLASQLDRDLTKAGMVTLFWGGGGGCRPVFVYTADGGRGVGKSKLAAMTSHLGGGAVELATDEDIEVIKQRLLSPDGITKRVALLDNVKSRGLSWAGLESLITAPSISGKQMYVGEASRLNVLTYLITLNGVALGTDLAQRSVVIKLDRPERSGTWEEETYAFIDQNRAALVGDIVGFLKRPRGHLERYSRWAAWERDVLSRLPDPEAAQRLIAERQGQADVEEEEGGLVEDFFAKQLKALAYEPECDAVYVPSEVAAAWYNGATGEKHRTITVGRILGQMAGEGRLHRLQPNSDHRLGRGFLWIGASWNIADATKKDIEVRIEASETEKRGRGRW
jgi:hypothetical protein